MPKKTADACWPRGNLQHVDGRALRRLYDKTVARGLRNSGLLIGARRGSASPSEIKPVEVNCLWIGTATFQVADAGRTIDHSQFTIRKG